MFFYENFILLCFSTVQKETKNVKYHVSQNTRPLWLFWYRLYITALLSVIFSMRDSIQLLT